MTEQEKLNFLRAMVGDKEEDNVLSTYLKIAGSKILTRAFPYKPEEKEVPSQYAMLQCEIAAYLMNKRGAEGQTMHTENGISRQYENADVPASLLKVVTPNCGVIR